MKQDLRQEVVVITGAANGIGAALARQYLAGGAKIAAVDVDREALGKLEGAVSYVADVSDEAQMDSIGRKIAADLGRPTIWINNAGIVVMGMFENTSSADFARVMKINFDGVVYGTRVALMLMKEPERGSIVNIASVAGTVPAPFIVSYTASKHAVVGFTRALREEKEQSQSALRIILVSPSFVRTNMIQKQGEYELPEYLKKLVREPEAVAKEIIHGIAAGRTEIMPGMDGRMMMTLYRMAPGLMGKSARLASARNWKQLLGLLPIKK